jgi:hypothetical protein
MLFILLLFAIVILLAACSMAAASSMPPPPPPPGGGGFGRPYGGMPPSPPTSDEEEEGEFLRVCKACQKRSYLRKGACANPACVDASVEKTQIVDFKFDLCFSFLVT